MSPRVSKAHAGRSPDSTPRGAGSHRPSSRRHPVWRQLGIAFVGFVLLLSLARAVLPNVVRNYVNRTLDQNPLYDGNIGKVNIYLWRGAYSIEDVRVSKTTGDVPVPFFAARRVDFAVEWKAMLERRLVGHIRMLQPELNFVDAPTEDEAQTGGDSQWLQLLKDLFPFKINSAIITGGAIHFRAYQFVKPVDIYLSQVEATVDNLTNIHDETNPLVATVRATGLAMDQAKFEYQMTLDPFSYRPTFHMGLRLLGLDVTKINDLSLAYGKFDFKRGWFDLVVETDSKEGQFTGYVKPLFRDLQVFSLGDDLQNKNVLEFFWQALVGGLATIFKNQARDQFGTLIPFSGDVSNATTTDLFAVLGNILRNAFIRAYLPRLEGIEDAAGDITFEPPQISDPIAPGDLP